MKNIEHCFLGAVLGLMALGMVSCGDEADEAGKPDEFCKGGCAMYQECPEEPFDGDFLDLSECIDNCLENWQDNYDHDLAIDSEKYGPGSKRCLDLEVDYTICFHNHASCDEWNAQEEPRECEDVGKKIDACWDALEDAGVTDPISTDDTDSVTGGECSVEEAAVCEEESSDCLQREDMAVCMDDFCKCLAAAGCETYQSCMEEYT